ASHRHPGFPAPGPGGALLFLELPGARLSRVPAALAGLPVPAADDFDLRLDGEFGNALGRGESFDPDPGGGHRRRRSWRRLSSQQAMSYFNLLSLKTAAGPEPWMRG